MKINKKAVYIKDLPVGTRFVRLGDPEKLLCLKDKPTIGTDTNFLVIPKSCRGYLMNSRYLVYPVDELQQSLF